MNRRGSVLVGALLTVSFLLILGVPVLQSATMEYKASINAQVRTQAFYLAEAGQQHCYSQLLSFLAAKTPSQRKSWAESFFVTDSARKPIVSHQVPTVQMSPGSYQATPYIEQVVAGARYNISISATGTANGSASLAQKLSLTLPLILGGFSFPMGTDGTPDVIPATDIMDAIAGLAQLYRQCFLTTRPGPQDLTTGYYPSITAATNGSISVPGLPGTTVTAATPSLSLAAGASISVDPGVTLNLLIEQTISLGTHVEVNIADDSAGQMNIIYLGTAKLLIKAQSSFTNVLVYAPNADVQVENNSTVYGSVAARSIVGTDIYIDNVLTNDAPGKSNGEIDHSEALTVLLGGSGGTSSGDGVLAPNLEDRQLTIARTGVIQSLLVSRGVE